METIRICEYEKCGKEFSPKNEKSRYCPVHSQYAFFKWKIKMCKEEMDYWEYRMNKITQNEFDEE